MNGYFNVVVVVVACMSICYPRRHCTILDQFSSWKGECCMDSHELSERVEELEATCCELMPAIKLNSSLPTPI